MDANGMVWLQPDVDEANVVRMTSPGAGGFSHYHNVSVYAKRDLIVGEEVKLWVKDLGWEFQESKTRARVIQPDSTPSAPPKSLKWLQQHGTCLDNLFPKPSKIPHAGRGAFAKRFLPKGSIVAPAPLMYIGTPEEMNVTYIPLKGYKKSHRKKEQDLASSIRPQLLLNYCHGRKVVVKKEEQDDEGRNETMVVRKDLYLAMAPLVNYINHAPTSQQVNVQLVPSVRFSNSNPAGTSSAIEDPPQWLHYDYVATRDIHFQEEILSHYGPEWERAWEEHVQTWKPKKDGSVAEGAGYSPAYVMDDVASILRTDKEQLSHPFPDNLRFSCFYRYATFDSEKVNGIVGGAEEEGEVGGNAEGKSPASSSSGTTTVKWTMDRRTFEFDHLRPCNILQREKLPNGQFVYTVLIHNRPGLAPEERIPFTSETSKRTQMHIVTGVPRVAIRFSDRAYSTDQHLENAFRHEIGLPEEDIS